MEGENTEAPSLPITHVLGEPIPVMEVESTEAPSIPIVDAPNVPGPVIGCRSSRRSRPAV